MRAVFDRKMSIFGVLLFFGGFFVDFHVFGADFGNSVGPGAGQNKRIAVIGAGVIGVSTALALAEDGFEEVVVFSDLPFENTTSYGPAGLFRLDDGKYRDIARQSFQRFSDLFRDFGGSTGVQSVSGYILSEDFEKLKLQESNYADIVYDFHFLNPRELSQFNPNRGNLSGIHYTAYTTEGRRYVPWMRQQAESLGVVFRDRHVNSVKELIVEGFDVVVNCAGLEGGRVAGDGDEANMYPIRGILLEVDAPWQKHFLYEDFLTFTIPTIESVFLGTVKQEGDARNEITDQDRTDIINRYIKLQPAFKNVNVISEWIGFRPGRKEVRLEAVHVNNQLIVHNYGHSGNGFVLSHGSALTVVQFVKSFFNNN